MISAFGVEHGEIAKARRRAPVGGPSAAQRAGFTAAGAHAKRGAGKFKAVAGAVGNKKISINDLGRGVGRGVGAVGQAATKSPTAAGLAVIGGGGYAAYRGLQSSSLPKKKRDA